MPESSALIVVDFQKDFISGTLAVPGAEEIVPKLWDLIQLFKAAKLPVVLTRDWHPTNHVSFDDEPRFIDKSWPAHCVQHTEGAEILGPIQSAARKGDSLSDITFSKGTDPNVEEYSGFKGRNSNGETLDDYLQDRAVSDVTVVGLATDYCVKATAINAFEFGYNVLVPADATRPVTWDTGAAAIAEIQGNYNAMTVTNVETIKAVLS